MARKSNGGEPNKSEAIRALLKENPKIKQLNPKLALPQLAIAPVYRSDGSGTNFLFTNYLSTVSPRACRVFSFHPATGRAEPSSR